MKNKYLLNIFALISCILLVSFFVYEKNAGFDYSNYLVIRVNDKIVDTYPTSNKYKVIGSCTKEGNPIEAKIISLWNNEKKRWNIKIENITESDIVCDINFVETSDPCDIPGYFCYQIKQSNNLISKDNYKIYKGTSEDNYVKFSNMKWRIIGINPDESIRLILSEPINEEKYNNELKCENPSKVSISSECATYSINNSIKSKLDRWLQNNISGSNSSFLTESLFCNDISNYSDLDTTYFGGYVRNEINNTPSLKCDKHVEIDYLSPKKEKHKIGLISVDEVKIIGTTNTYLSNLSNTWTMSPKKYTVSDSKIKMYLINGESFVSTPNKYAPVINISKNTIVSGDGKVENPYLLLSIEKP